MNSATYGPYDKNRHVVRRSDSSSADSRLHRRLRQSMARFLAPSPRGDFRSASARTAGSRERAAIEAIHRTPDWRAVFVAETAVRLSMSCDGNDYLACDLPDTVAVVDEFLEVYLESPLDLGNGGLGFVGGLNLFFALRRTRPHLYVESGVHRGGSLYLASRALPQGSLVGVDISLSQLEHHPAEATVLEGDLWEALDGASISCEDAFVFLDDHQSHLDRLEEARRRGIRYAFVDDAWNTGALWLTGEVPFPSVPTIFALGLLESSAPSELVAENKQGSVVQIELPPELVLRCQRFAAVIEAPTVMPETYARTLVPSFQWFVSLGQRLRSAPLEGRKKRDRQP